MKEEMPKKTDMSADSKLMGAISYLWILSIVMLFIKKDDAFVKFHAKQGLILFIVSFVGWIPVIGWIIALIILLFVILGFFKALSGEWYEVPLVGPIAKKINL